MGDIFAGIDVGTGSARAGLFTADGKLLASARRPLAMWREAGEIVEQSSDDIWQAVTGALREALAESNIDPARVGGVGFDATCSLVVLDELDAPLSVSPSGDDARNVIVWMDHRAVVEARQINEMGDATGDDVLKYVGGSISPEMEMPKLLWLKRHMPATLARAGHLFDLADYLSWRATGSAVRSTCTLTCKWTYLAHEQRWSDEFLDAIGLGELAADQHWRIGRTVAPPGTAVGSGLTREAARELGLNAGTPVGAGLIDAHAGGLGTIGGQTGEGTADPTRRLAYIMGTSACVMATTAVPTFVPGVWGPYYDAMVPGLWLNEGGQSAAGAAIDHLMRSHAAYDIALAEAQDAHMGLLDYLEARIASRFGDLSHAAMLATDRHILPEFLGNRSPHADPDARAAIIGAALDDTVADLEVEFVAGLCGLAYGLAEVIEALAKNGVAPDEIVASGGASHSRLVRQILADATGLRVTLPETPEPVLLGAAMLGAVAGGAYASLPAAMAAMSRDGVVTMPGQGTVARFHAAKREGYTLVRQTERALRERMAEFRS